MKKRIVVAGSAELSAVEKAIDKGVATVLEAATADLEPLLRDKPIDYKTMLSTGSTLLDLCLTGGRVYGGGCPGGILLEVYGRSGSGKTSILSELGGAAQALGGEVRFADPEARLDAEYAETYGLSIPDKNYFKPDTVSELFKLVSDWDPPEGKINVFAADSLAALSTELEMEKGDKMGMRRAKEFSEGLRKYCRLIEKKNWLIACSNQVRQGDYGDVTPGGRAVEFYASARISINRSSFIEKEKTLTGKKKIHKRVVGIISQCKVTKSSIDKPYRECPVYIMFDYGIDDVRANLQYVKDTAELTTYWVGDDAKGYSRMDDAIAYIEKNNLENLLRDRTIALWTEVENKFKQERKKKTR
jgi:recombination protein RecA